MTVEVPARRGDADTVHAWVDGYVPRLTEMPRSTEAIDDDIWRTALGDGKRLGDRAQRFNRQIAERAVLEGLVDAAT